MQRALDHYAEQKRFLVALSQPVPRVAFVFPAMGALRSPSTVGAIPTTEQGPPRTRRFVGALGAQRSLCRRLCVDVTICPGLRDGLSFGGIMSHAGRAADEQDPGG